MGYQLCLSLILCFQLWISKFSAHKILLGRCFFFWLFFTMQTLIPKVWVWAQESTFWQGCQVKVTQVGPGAPLEKNSLLLILQFRSDFHLQMREQTGSSEELRNLDQVTQLLRGQAFALFVLSPTSSAPPTRLPAHGEICQSLERVLSSLHLNVLFFVWAHFSLPPPK